MFSPEFLTAVKNGLAFSWTSVTYDYDAADSILTVCNDDPSLKLNMEAVDLYSDTITEYVIHNPAYATWAGTSVTGKNLNLDSNLTATATATADETGQATQGGKICSGNILADSVTRIWLPKVRLGYHKAISVDYVDAGTGGTVTWWGYYST